MSPRWLTGEKLVAELGTVCSAHAQVEALVPEPRDEESLAAATRAVAAALADPGPTVDAPGQPDEVVRKAWTAIAVAQDRVARLSVEVARARALCDQAQRLQDESSRLREERRRRDGQRGFSPMVPHD